VTKRKTSEPKAVLVPKPDTTGRLKKVFQRLLQAGAK
jgi:hypothetical protein